MEKERKLLHRIVSFVKQEAYFSWLPSIAQQGINVLILSLSLALSLSLSAQSAGAVEYTDCFSAEG